MSKRSLEGCATRYSRWSARRRNGLRVEFTADSFCSSARSCSMNRRTKSAFDITALSASLHRRSFNRRPLHGERLRDECAVAAEQLTTFEKHCFPTGRFPVKPYL